MLLSSTSHRQRDSLAGLLGRERMEGTLPTLDGTPVDREDNIARP